MADDNITITFSDGPENDASQSNASTPLGDGVTEKKEDKEQLFERLFGDLTDTMSDIFNLLSGDSTNGDFFSSIRETAASILGDSSNGDSFTDASLKDKDASFTKASKIAGLKPEDINIVDQQYILGALLINSTLVRIESLLKDSSKNKNKSSSEGKAETTKGKGKGLGSLKSDVKDLNEINELAAVMIPVLMNNMKLVKWGLVKSFFKNLKSTLKDCLEIAETLDKNRKSIDSFVENAKNLIGGTLIVAMGLSVLGLFTPLMILGTAGAFVLQLAITPLLAVANKVASSKNTSKYEKNAKDIRNGTLALTASMILLTIMLPFLIPAMLATGLLMVEMLLINVLLRVMPKPALTIKGTVSALLLAVFFSSLALAVFMVSTVNMDFKKTITNLGIIALVAIAGGALAAILGIPFIMPLIALGTVSAVLLAVFFGAIVLALKIVGKASQYTDAAIAALGHVSKRSVNGDDGTEKKDATGILGFFSTLGSWPFIKALLLSVVTNSLLALNGLALIISATLMYAGFKIMNNISEDFFPIGKSLGATGPGAAIMAINHFTKYMAGKEDDRGNPITDGEAIIGWKTLLMLVPLIAYGLLLKLAAKSLKDGFNTFAEEIKSDKLQPALDGITSLGAVFRTIKNTFATDNDEEGPIGKLLSFLGFGDLVDAAHILGACLPLLSLAVYGQVLQLAAKPLAEGIQSLADVKPERVTKAKMDKIKDVMTSMSEILGDASDKGFLASIGDRFKDTNGTMETVAGAINAMVSALPSLTSSLATMGKLNTSEFSTGVVSLAVVLDALFGNNASNNALISLVGKYKPGFMGISSSSKAGNGGIISILTTISSNNISKNNTELFKNLLDAVVSLQPVIDSVISFASLDEAALSRGINGVKTIFDSCTELLSIMNPGNSEENIVGQVLTIMENNSASKAMDNNPLKAIISLFTELGDFNEFSQNVGTFSTSITKLASAANVMEGIDLTGFESFIRSVKGAYAGVEVIGALVSYKSEVDALAESFDRVGDALDRISNADISQFTRVINEANASAEKVLEAQRSAQAAAQSTAVVNAVDEYTKYIAQMLCNWEVNGIKLRGDDTQPLAVETPKVNNATTSFNWGN